MRKKSLKLVTLILAAALAFADRATISQEFGAAPAGEGVEGQSGRTSAKISSELRRRDSDRDVDVIVQFQHVPTEAHHQKIRNHGGALKTDLPIVKGALYSIPAAALDDLAKDPEVVYMSPDRNLGAMLDYTAAAVNATIAWQSGWVGWGIGVAIINSGILGNPDFRNPI